MDTLCLLKVKYARIVSEAEYAGGFSVCVLSELWNAFLLGETAVASLWNG